MSTKFLIWSFRHKAWWKAEGKGYTPKRNEAGRFTFDEALGQRLDPVSEFGHGPSGDALILESER